MEPEGLLLKGRGGEVKEQQKSPFCELKQFFDSKPLC